MKLGHTLGLIAFTAGLFAVPAHAQYNSFVSVADATTVAGATAFADARINAGGQVLFRATVATDPTFFLNTGGTNTRLLGRGDASPLAGVTYNALDSNTYSLDNAGRVTFRSSLAGAGIVTSGAGANNTAIFRYVDSAATNVVIRRGTALNGVTLTVINSYDANNSGAVAVQGTSGGAASLFIVNGSNVTTVAAQGQSLPGGTPGVYGSAIFFPDIDNNGAVTFTSNISNNLNAERGVFNRSAGGTTTVVAVQGSPANPQGDPFTFFSQAVRNDSGIVSVFGGYLPNGAAQRINGIWTGSGSLTPIALQGGTFAGATFGSAFEIGNINATGTGVFRASNMTGAFTDAVFAYTGTAVTKVLSQGDSILGSTVTSLGAPSINDDGDIAVNYLLANGQRGILVASVEAVVVPEPGSVALVALSAPLLGALYVARRKRVQK